MCAPRARTEHAVSSSTIPRFRAFVFNRHYQMWQERWAEDIARYEPPGEGDEAAIQRALARVDVLWRLARPRREPSGRPTPAYDPDGDEEQRLRAGIRFARLAMETRERYAETLEAGLDRIEQELAQAGVERSRLEQELADARARADEMEAELTARRERETEVAHLRELAQTLAAIESGGWWRLRGRLLPLLRLARRLRWRQRR